MNERPNVLMITTDHWSHGLFGSMGLSGIKTPFLDNMIRTGIHFTGCYSDCPVCIPARRSLMTGMTPKSHGDRIYSDRMLMPEADTLAGCFARAGYSTFAVGKLHVYPQRDRIGFNDAILSEEARYQFSVVDDYQMWLSEKGYTGMEYLHGMGNNQYYTRPWHLPEETHPTNWATNQMIRTIKRRDPTKPFFYYLSYINPHPPLVPLKEYLDMYDADDIEGPVRAKWNEDPVFPVKALTDTVRRIYTKKDIFNARKAVYALCTHIDHQLRLVLGTLREEGLLDDTIILFTSDHGDMLGDHDMQMKRVFYEKSAHIPMIISGVPLKEMAGTKDDRLCCLEDVMPTLLDICNIEIPLSVDGMSMLSSKKRDMLYCEITENDLATRAVMDGRHKLIYYPVGNYTQLFDLDKDPREENNLAQSEEYTVVKGELISFLIENLYKGDEKWVKNGVLIGLPDKEFVFKPDFNLSGQRGGHWPPPIN